MIITKLHTSGVCLTHFVVPSSYVSGDVSGAGHKRNKRGTVLFKVMKIPAYARVYCSAA